MRSSKGRTERKERQKKFHGRNKKPNISFDDKFWAQTKYSTQNAASNDEVRALSDLHLKNQTEFLMVFSDTGEPVDEALYDPDRYVTGDDSHCDQSKGKQESDMRREPDMLMEALDPGDIRQNSIQMMASKIDPTLTVTENQWAVSMVRKHLHAYLVVESIGFHKDEGLCMRWFDFLPEVKNGKNRAACFGVWANPGAFIGNKVVSATPRYCPTNDGAPLSNIPEHVSREELLVKLNWHEKTSTCLCPADAVMAMLNDIKNDFDKANDHKLRFRKRSKFNIEAMTTNRVPNCTTWIWQKLKVADIEAASDTKMNHIVVEAAGNMGPKHPIKYVGAKLGAQVEKSQTEEELEQSLDQELERANFRV